MNRHGTLTVLAALLVGSLASAADPELTKSREELLRENLELKALLARQDRLGEYLERMAKSLDRIERAMEARSPTATTRISASFVPTAPAPVGTIRLDNRLGVNATVFLDGVGYSVPPFTVRTVPNRPAGALTYEATAEGRGMGLPVRSVLAANETLTVTIY